MLKLKENPLFHCCLCIFPCNGLTRRAWDLGRRKQNFSDTRKPVPEAERKSEHRLVLREGTTCVVVRTILFQLSPPIFYSCNVYLYSRRTGRSLPSILQACRMGEPDPGAHLLCLLLELIFTHSILTAF